MVNILENPIKMDDVGVPLFLKTSIWRLGGEVSSDSTLVMFFEVRLQDLGRLRTKPPSWKERQLDFGGDETTELEGTLF